MPTMPESSDPSPQDERIEALVVDAEAALAGDDPGGAKRLCEEILALDPCFSQAHMVIARCMMPGLDYLQILFRLHHHLLPDSYVEIGVATGKSLKRARPETLALGIDPEPRINREIKARARLYPMTSDDFFQRFNLGEELGNRSPELCFIDGLHEFEQTLRDFINIEKYASSSTVVLIHDCFPPTRLSAERERNMAYWVGDVWRVIPCLRQYRPDLQLAVIPAMPSGLALVTGLDSASRVLADNYDEIVDWARKLSYGDMENDRQGVLNTVENDWRVIQEMLPA
jgi:hypothetical protein